ncbi:MAG: hypothetical protein HFF53_04400 [Lawsonibacter sp.]|jgi:lysophospholipase L1-like esterase|nr:hypothetical protein [Lawsonibacter sp.]
MPIIYRGKRQLKVRVLGLALGVAAAAALCWLAWTVGRPAPEPPPPGQSLPKEKSPAPLPEQDPSSPAETYDFTRPAPERAPVDNSYFQNAAFVGDSRTDGFLIYSGIGTGKNLTSNGLSIFKLEEKKALTIDGEKYTLLEALALEQYSQVYLSLGVNELGYYNDAGFYQSYCAAIDHIRRLQPQAVIYIQGLIPLNEGQIVAANGNKYNLTNDHLRVYNDLMRQAAEEKQAVFLDLYTEFVDENGELPAEGSHDGVHLSAEYCRRWLEYLKAHTVEFDTLYPDGPPPVEEPEAETVQPEGSGEE